MANIVLVHGACLDSTPWNEVAERLRGQGHVVAAPDLALRTLEGDTAIVQEAVDAMGGPVVACGWSYGGMVITGLDLAGGSHLVYIAALLPSEGDTAYSLSNENPTRLDGLFQLDAAGDLSLDGDLAAALWADAPAEVASSAAARSRSQALASLTTAPTALAWQEHESTYAICTNDEAVDPQLQRRFAAKAGAVVEWDSSHSPMLSMPGVVATFISGIADRIDEDTVPHRSS